MHYWKPFRWPTMCIITIEYFSINDSQECSVVQLLFYLHNLVWMIQMSRIDASMGKPINTNRNGGCQHYGNDPTKHIIFEIKFPHPFTCIVCLHQESKRIFFFAWIFNTFNSEFDHSEIELIIRELTGAINSVQTFKNVIDFTTHEKCNE